MRLQYFSVLLTFCAIFGAQGQHSDTLYFEDFEGANPNFTSTNTLSGGNQWQLNNRLAYRGNHCVKAQPDSGQLTTIEFITDTFSVAASDFVRLEWSHIAKLPFQAGGDILVSNNGGSSWLLLTRQNIGYYGTGNVYNARPASSFFNINAYDTGFARNWLGPLSLPANNQQWKREGIDLSNVVFGQTNILIKFRMRLLTANNVNPQPDGWYLDDIAVIRDSCEPFKPQISQSHPLTQCTDVPLSGGQLKDSLNSYQLKVRVKDSASFSSQRISGIDSVAVYYRDYSQTNMGTWQNGNMTLLPNGAYKFHFNNVLPGDTVQYYVQAVDKSCRPNTTHFPVIARRDSSYLFYPEDLPGKCGTIACSKSPGIINVFPWREDFEDSEWVPGTGNGQSGAVIRGDFANEGVQNAAWTVTPNENQAGYGWAVRSGPTPTLLTGPQRNHTPGGHQYLYTEADQGAALASTELILPCIDLSSDTTPKILSFYYHRFGSDITNLRIDIDTGKKGSSYIINYDRITGQSQNSSSDAWKRKSMSLAPFAGKIIRIRFFAAKIGAQDIRNDMALDDFSIENAQNTDVALSAAYDLKDSAGCFNNARQVLLKVQLQNMGQQTLDTIPLVVEVNHNGNTTKLQDTLMVSLARSASTTVTLNKGIDLYQTGSYRVSLYANLPQDGNISNDTALTQTFAVWPAIAQFPFAEDFEQAGTPHSQGFAQTIFEPEIKNWQLLAWQIGRDFTPKKATGPLTGFYRKGKYAYVSANTASGSHSSALSVNRCIDFTGISNPAVSFAYHAYSPSITKLEVQARQAGGNWQTVKTFNSPGNRFNSELSPWITEVASLNSFSNARINLRFVVTGSSNPSLRDNLALDQIVIYDQANNDLGITGITNPGEAALAHLNLAIINPAVNVTNYGRTINNSIKVEMSVRRLCDATGQVKTYRDPGTKIISPGITLNYISQVPLVLQSGACEVCAYIVNNAGDARRSNDTLCRIITGRKAFSNSFKTTFDSCRYEKDGFAATDGLLQWQKGMPTGSVISSAQSSPNVWATNLSGKYTNHLNEELRTPSFLNVNPKDGALIRYWQYLDSVPKGRLEFRTNNGWKPLGDPGDIFKWQNWYNGPFGDFASKSFTGSSGGWKLSQAPLTDSNGLPNNLVLRFVLETDTSRSSNRSAGEGWAIDDFEIFIPPQNSVSPEQLILPRTFPNAGTQPWGILFKNTGEKTLQDWKIKAFVNGSLQDSATISNQVLLKGQTRLINFPRPLNLSNGSNDLMLVTSQPNGNPDDFVQDDTLRISLPVTSVIDTNQSCSDFENGDYLVPGFTNSSTGLWQRVTPGKANLNSAQSGSKVWITDTAAHYSNLTRGTIYTPAFKVDSGLCYQLSFAHQFATEQNFDGGTVEFLIAGGTNSWSTLGSYNANDSLWFNSPHIQAYNRPTPGWSGSSGQWQKAAYTFSASESATVRFRFRFASGGSVTGEGWAIDDICITNVRTNCDSTVSLREIGHQQSLKVYPNPARYTIHLEWLQAPTEPGLVQVVNAQGKLMYSRNAWQSPKLDIDVSHWSRGIYFVIVRGAGAPKRHKIMIQ